MWHCHPLRGRARNVISCGKLRSEIVSLYRDFGLHIADKREVKIYSHIVRAAAHVKVFRARDKILQFSHFSEKFFALHNTEDKLAFTKRSAEFPIASFSHATGSRFLNVIMCVHALKINLRKLNSCLALERYSQAREMKKKPEGRESYIIVSFSKTLMGKSEAAASRREVGFHPSM